MPANATDFSVWVTVSVGPIGKINADLFRIEVCTPRNLATQIDEKGPVWGRHKLIVRAFDPAAIILAVQRYLEGCSGADWIEVGSKVARIGHWEFEDYKPSLPTGL